MLFLFLAEGVVGRVEIEIERADFSLLFHIFFFLHFFFPRPPKQVENSMYFFLLSFFFLERNGKETKKNPKNQKP